MTDLLRKIACELLICWFIWMVIMNPPFETIEPDKNPKRLVRYTHDGREGDSILLHLPVK